MQHLRPEVRELGGLAVREVRERERLGRDPRIGREHAVHVGPDHDLVGVERPAEDRRRVVAAAAAERRRDALVGGGDEAGDDGNRAGVDLGKAGADEPLGFGEVDRRLAEGVVGADEVRGVERDGGVPGRPERGGDDGDRQPLAGGDDGVLKARRAFAKEIDPVEQFGDAVENGFQRRIQHRPLVLERERIDGLGVARAERGEAVGVLARPPLRRLDRREQFVRHPAERRRHDDGPHRLRHRRHEADDFAHTLGRPHRTAAELGDADRPVGVRGGHRGTGTRSRAGGALQDTAPCGSRAASPCPVLRPLSIDRPGVGFVDWVFCRRR